MLILSGMSVGLMARVVGMLTPVPARIAGPLLGGMRSDSVVHDEAASRDFPQIEPVDYETSVRQALQRLSPGTLETGWEKGASSFRTNRKVFLSKGNKSSWMPFLKQLTAPLPAWEAGMAGST